MDAPDLLKLITRWTAPVIVITAGGAAAGYGVSHVLPKRYTATGTVLVAAAPRNQNASTFNLTANQVTATDAVLMTQRPLLAKVHTDVKPPFSLDDLAKEVTATPQVNTELIDVSATDADPARAAAIADDLMTVFVNQVQSENSTALAQSGAALESQIKDLESTLASENAALAAAQQKHQDTSALQSQIQSSGALLTQLTTNYSSFRAAQAENFDTVTVASPATPPSVPSSPRVALNTAVGGIAGLLAGLALAALVQFLDQGLRNEEDVRRKLGLTTLAVIPRYTPTAPGAQRNSIGGRRSEVAAEAYRRMRTNLLFAALDQPLHSLIMTSARSGEGKTRTAANLAAVVAAAGQRVLLVDADLRRPSQHKLFGKRLDNGMSDVLLQLAHQSTPSLNGEHTTNVPNLTLLTSGTIPPNPAELLASKHVTGLVRHFETQFDLVVFDTPPTEAVTDALNLAGKTSAAVLVIEAGRTNARQARRSLDALRTVGATVVGVVLNKARRNDMGRYEYYYYSSQNEEGGKRRHRDLGGEGQPWQPIGAATRRGNDAGPTPDPEAEHSQDPHLVG